MTRGDIISTMRQSIATDQAAALNRNDETTPLSFLAVLTFALSLTMRSYSLVVLRKQLLGGDDFITFSTLTARHAPGGIRHRHVGGRYAAAFGGARYSPPTRIQPDLTCRLFLGGHRFSSNRKLSPINLSKPLDLRIIRGSVKNIVVVEEVS